MKTIPHSIPIILLLVGGILMTAIYSRGVVSSYSSTTIPNNEVLKDTPFDKMMQVLTHERCINCHPNDNIPKQGKDSHPHYFGMKRGEDNLGFTATQCTTCHQPENNDYSGVPGAPHWSLAPKSMGWQGLDKYEIAKAMLDRAKNGNRSHDELVHHLTEDSLVLWAFDPGVDHEGIPRETPPISEAEYKAAVIAWFENGAIIPKE
ncbi:hypothetical protein FK220_015200 [Flavobacteriaceae bacterium TP-CH-4]|uniref:Cytochrome c domain-containing protein n=1 Tax=Pelagihabitans pacificus TaxID=2696054 RepID=A0A967B262_9FLAO|nr:hypothetical protein [Pelagihabitans pacificus]NHF60701.1 hypothetical protein [Pelagihabitans pacificus]